MTTEMQVLPLSKVKLNEENANEHNEVSIDTIKGLLLRFGQVEPVVVDRTTKVVQAGNGRCTALQEIANECEVDHEVRKRALAWGLVVERTRGKVTWYQPQVKVMFQKFQDGLEAKAYGLADNRSAQFSRLKPDQVDTVLLAVEQANRDWQALGYSQMDWEAVRLAAQQAEEAAKPKEKPTTTKTKTRDEQPDEDPEDSEDDDQDQADENKPKEVKFITLELELQPTETAEFADLMAIMNHHRVAMGVLVMQALRDKSIKLLDENQG